MQVHCTEPKGLGANNKQISVAFLFEWAGSLIKAEEVSRNKYLL